MKLTIDTREPEELGVALRVKGHDVLRDMMDVGDLSFLSPDESEINLVTRKTSDMLDSVFSGHFTDELMRCIQTITSYGKGKLFWIVEGVWASSGDSPNMAYFKRRGYAFEQASAHFTPVKAYYGLQLSTQLAGVYFLVTDDVYGTADAIDVLCTRCALGWPTRIARGIKRPELVWNPDDNRLARLMALWPRLQEKQAIDLLKRHKTIGQILTIAMVNPSRLLKQKGLGKKAIENLMEVLGDAKVDTSAS